MTSLKKYCKYYYIGYLNNFIVAQVFGNSFDHVPYQEKKLQATLDYLSIRVKNLHFFIRLIPLFLYIELIMSLLVIIFRFVVISVRSCFIRKRVYKGYLFNPSLTYSDFRVRKFLEPLRPQRVSTLKIPFINHCYKENDISILSAISFEDIVSSFFYSISVVIDMFRRYRNRDCFFRSYSSFEFLLTCCFVKNTEHDNDFVYFNTYDRWALLFCNVKSKSVFIQHGSLTDDKLIKVGTPTEAYYISIAQKEILERNLFKKTPSIVKYRPSLLLTDLSIIKSNGKKNVLLVCCNRCLNEEWEIVKTVSPYVNLYIKPHPADTHNPAYQTMASTYDGVIVKKSEYPRVDCVISYESTLADEYEDVGVKVIRYEKLNNFEDIIPIIKQI